MTLKRIFLFRRRIESYLLIAGAAGLPFRKGITPLIAIVFAAIGIYLVVARHRSARVGSYLFIILAFAYLVWTLSLIAFRGEPFIGNRQVVYSSMICLLAFIGSGMVLVRHPLDAFIVGCRVGTVAVAIVAIFASIVWGVRFGMGGNPAPWSLVVSICALAAIIPVRLPPKWAPDSSFYLLVAIIPLAASETRAVLAPLLFILMVEAIRWLWTKNWAVRCVASVAGLSVLVALSFVDPFHSVLYGRVLPAIQFGLGNAPGWGGGESDTIRLYMWMGALHAFVQHPLIGLGAARMEVVALAAPAMNEAIAQYEHVHNIFLDELITQGLIGLVLLIGALSAALRHLYRENGDTFIRLNIFYTTLTVLSYGMLHNPLSHETTIAGIFLYIGVLMAHTSRSRMRVLSKIPASTTTYR